MQTMTLDAKATTLTDQGEVRLLVSTYDKDRGGDVIKRGAFAESIRQWQSSGRKIPLHFDHKADPESIIGAADPASMRETDEGLVVEAKLDLEDSEKAREVWRLVKADALACSFGYVADGETQADGTRLLSKVDLFEVTLTPSPMNPHTRVLAWKSETTFPPELELIHEIAGRDPDEYVRERQQRKAAEAETKRQREPIQLASFSVEQ